MRILDFSKYTQYENCGKILSTLVIIRNGITLCKYCSNLKSIRAVIMLCGNYKICFNLSHRRY